MERIKNERRKDNPRENANFLSIATFFYTIPTFIKGFKKDLEEEDLYETYTGHKSDVLGNKMERLWKKELERSKKANRKPSLSRVLLNCFGFDHFSVGFALLLNELVVKTCQISALGDLVSFYMNANQQTDKKEAYFCATKIIISSLLSVLIAQPMSMSGYHMGLKMRVACCSLIYRKVLKLSKLAFEKTTSGQIVNLLSNDLKSMDKFPQMSHYIWIGPIQTIFLSYFMYKEAGYCSVFGVLFLFIFIPLHFFMGRLFAVYRNRSAFRTDERIRLMNEIILGISVIKMYTWEKPFAKLIAEYRRFEMKAIKKAAHLKGMYSACVLLNSKIAVFFTIVSYVLVNDKINAHQVFVLIGLYNLLRQTMLVFFPNGVTLAAETSVCFTRITNFLLLEETNNVYEENDEQKDAIVLEGVSAKWSSKSDNFLNKLNLRIRPGSLTAIIGLVGSGKSSIINAILQEMLVVEGNIFIKGKISYASQDPWLFDESVKQNILFGNKLDRQRYMKVVKACALQRDFYQLQYSDETLVGERGSTLSGGQKSRVNLARAVYSEADIYLLDDPLSAVDTEVGNDIFEKCIKRYLKGKTVVLVTHQLQYVKNVDHIVVVENGSVIAQGNPLELQNSGIDFGKFLINKELICEDVGKQFSRSESTGSKLSLVNEEKVLIPNVVAEQKSIGAISGNVYKEYLRSGAHPWIICGAVFVLITFQVLMIGSDYFLAYWVNLAQIENESNSTSSSQGKLSLIYTGFIFALIIISAVRSFMLIEMCMKASTVLHNNMFASIIRGTLNFFNGNTSGRILNRFSKDMGAIDELLPNSIIDVTSIAITVVGTVVLTNIVHPVLIIPVIIITIIFYLLRNLYIGTSRSVKRLEGVTKSSVLAHLNVSIQGLSTIRSAKAQSLLVKQFDSHHDLNNCASYLFLATSKSFGYWLDLFCVVYITIVTFSSLFSESEQLGGNVGLIMSQSLLLTGVFQWGMRQTTEFENQMTSVERVLEYSAIEMEALQEEKERIESDWPNNGHIQFVNVSLKYLPDSDYVLQNINFTIEPLEKIGIVGRTGAGKSSLIAALFRLTDVEGSVFIDSIDTKNLSLHQARSNLSIIPQQPILFSGSVRKNLDPFDEFDDEVLWKALEEVELKDTIANSLSGLNSEISEGGSNLSVGQRQLVCLARALLRNNKILILDEATANVDHITDALIQNTIRKNFTQCTVLTIAHRLDTIIDCDKILVMSEGRVVEFDHPHLLLQKRKGPFFEMVEQTGILMSQNLINIAKMNYRLRNS
ncbi:hypothetical protein FQA39_LY05142 [Lamprigera yunnana]|nr:hypothetical protein FQA39_LY05142 [Lamprigera yunnana]